MATDIETHKLIFQYIEPGCYFTTCFALLISFMRTSLLPYSIYDLVQCKVWCFTVRYNFLINIKQIQRKSFFHTLMKTKIRAKVLAYSER